MKFVNATLHIYLLQRLTASLHRSLDRVKRQKIRLSEFFDFDYMGAAEYEFGAAAKAIRLFTNNVNTFTNDDYKFVNRDITHYFRVNDAFNVTPTAIMTYFIFKKEVSEEYIDAYIQHYQDVVNNDRRLKEYINGCKSCGFKDHDQPIQSANFDIRNAVFIYYDKRLSHLVLELFRNSITYMIEQL